MVSKQPSRSNISRHAKENERFAPFVMRSLKKENKGTSQIVLKHLFFFFSYLQLLVLCLPLLLSLNKPVCSFFLSSSCMKYAASNDVRT